LNQIKIRS